MIRPALALVVLLTGCAAGREISWEERVEASTGDVFTVKRSELRRYVAEPLQKGGWLFQQATIEGVVPGIGAIRWQTSLRPWLLDRATDGRWYFVAMLGSYGSASEYGVFDGTDRGPQFVFYRQREGDWERILGKDLPSELTSPNLLVFGEALFEPHPDDPYWRAQPPPKRRFWNGEVLDLQTKRRVNVPLHPDSAWRFRLTPGWRMDSSSYLVPSRGRPPQSIPGSP